MSKKQHRLSLCSRTKRLVLVIVLCVEVVTILANWTALWSFVEFPQRSLHDHVGKKRASRFLPKPPVLYLRDVVHEGQYFEPNHKRMVEHVWDGARDLNHKFPEFKSILRNPGTLGSKNGEKVCKPAAKWQTEFNPTCNSFHEMGFALQPTRTKSRNNNLSDISVTTDDALLELLGVGTSIHAWKVANPQTDNPVVLKTLQMECKSGCGFNDKFYHKQTLDAVASERLTSSPYVLDVYGFCGMSVINEFGRFLQTTDGLSVTDRLKYSRDLAAGMADMHSVGGTGHAMITHGDFKPSNVIFSLDGKNLKLSDFNKGRFLGWNTKANEPCGYLSARSFAGPYILAPEEWFGKVRTEKTDVYHLGGMIFYLLTGKKPYNWNDPKDLQDRDERFESKGEWAVPTLPDDIRQSKDPAVAVMRRAIERTILLHPKNRASAKEVFQMLNATLKKVNGKR